MLLLSTFKYNRVRGYVTLVGRGNGWAMGEQGKRNGYSQTYFEGRVQKPPEISCFWKEDPILSGNYYEKGLRSSKLGLSAAGSGISHATPIK